MTTPAALSARCTAAGLQVLSAEQQGGRVVVTVKAWDKPTVETVIRRLGRHVTLSWGDGTGDVECGFMTGDGE